MKISHFQTFIIVLMLFPSICLSQENFSLKLNQAQNDSARCDLLIKHSNLYVRQNADSAWFYINLAKEIAEKNYDDYIWAKLMLGNIHRDQGNLHYYSNNFNEAIKSYALAAENYQKVSSLEPDAAAERINLALARLYVNMGVVYTYLGNYDLAMQKYIDALTVYEKINDISGMASCYLGMANLDSFQKEYDRAIQKLNQACELYQTIGDKSNLANCYNSLGGIYFEKKEFDLAIETFLKTQKFREELNDKSGVSTAYTNLANVYLGKGEFEKSLEYFTKSLAIDQTLGDMYSVAVVQANIASLYDKMATSPNVDPQARVKYFYLALEYGKMAYANAKEMDVLPLNNFIYSILCLVNRSIGNYPDADFYFEKYVQTNDSLYSNEKAKALSEIQTIYETQKKQQEIDYLSAVSRRQKAVTYTILIGFLLVAILSSVLLKLFIQKKKANMLLNEQKEQITLQNANLQQANEEILAQHDEISAQRDLVISQKQKLEDIHTQVTNSIRYAQSIQAAILPSEKKLADISPDFFVVMKPCELVSGDFFWASTFNEYKVFCVADCTGHGVPGAFMSILGISALNEIVSNHRVTKANDILGYIRASVIDSLSQNDPLHLHKDGMDIGVCIFNTETKQLQFAGARIPLWIVTENDSAISWDGATPSCSFANNYYSLYEIKGDIMPVGMSPKMEPFRNNNIFINNPVSLFLATDGYADQFGQTDKTKFTTKRLKNLILENVDKPFSLQGEFLDSTFEEWRGTEYQLDDVTILGIKL